MITIILFDAILRPSSKGISAARLLVLAFHKEKPREKTVGGRQENKLREEVLKRGGPHKGKCDSVHRSEVCSESEGLIWGNVLNRGEIKEINSDTSHGAKGDSFLDLFWTLLCVDKEWGAIFCQRVLLVSKCWRQKAGVDTDPSAKRQRRAIAQRGCRDNQKVRNSCQKEVG